MFYTYELLLIIQLPIYFLFMTGICTLAGHKSPNMTNINIHGGGTLFQITLGSPFSLEKRRFILKYTCSNAHADAASWIVERPA